MRLRLTWWKMIMGLAQCAAALWLPCYLFHKFDPVSTNKWWSFPACVSFVVFGVMLLFGAGIWFVPTEVKGEEND